MIKCGTRGRTKLGRFCLSLSSCSMGHEDRHFLSVLRVLGHEDRHFLSVLRVWGTRGQTFFVCLSCLGTRGQTFFVCPSCLGTRGQTFFVCPSYLGTRTTDIFVSFVSGPVRIADSFLHHLFLNTVIHIYKISYPYRRTGLGLSQAERNYFQSWGGAH